MVPMNLLRGKRKADYVNTGQWSQRSTRPKYCHANIAASSEDARFTYAPSPESWLIDSDTAYVHYTPNETIGGVEFNWVPDLAQITGGKIDAPLVADMSSNILSRPLDVTPFGLIYAGAQKNIANAGLTLVIIREDLLNTPIAGTPTMYAYKTHADHHPCITPRLLTPYISWGLF